LTSFIVLIKSLVIYLLPFYLIHRYLKAAYGVSPWRMMGWWRKNWRRQNHIGMVIVFTLLAILFTSMVTSGALNRAYLAVVGEDHELVYIGNPRAGFSHYISLDDLSAVPLQTLGEYDYNTSFNSIYRTETFRKDRGHHGAGVRLSEFHVTYLIANVLMALAVYIFLACMLHIVAHPVSKAAAGENVEMASVDNLDKFLRRWNLSKGKLGALFFGSLPLAMLFILFTPASSLGHRAIPLPASVVPGSELRAIPVSISVETERYRRDSSDDQIRYRETGYINLVYQFTEDFEFPVYVSARYQKEHYPGLYEEMKAHIKERRPMPVRVQEGLTVRPQS
jgi:hypothetical protein